MCKCGGGGIQSGASGISDMPNECEDISNADKSVGNKLGVRQSHAMPHYAMEFPRNFSRPRRRQNNPEGVVCKPSRKCQMVMS